MRYIIRSVPSQDYNKAKQKEAMKKETHSCVPFALRPASEPSFLVEVTGFEPMASWSRTKRATNCATPRHSYFICFLLLPYHNCQAVGRRQRRFRAANIVLAEFATNNTLCWFAERKFPTALHLDMPNYYTKHFANLQQFCKLNLFSNNKNKLVDINVCTEFYT